MVDIVLRQVKGSELTIEEGDQNFQNLKGAVEAIETAAGDINADVSAAQAAASSASSSAAQSLSSKNAAGVSAGLADDARIAAEQAVASIVDDVAQAEVFRNEAQGFSEQASASEIATDTLAQSVAANVAAAIAAAELVGSYVGMFPTTAAGLAAVTDGKYFSTPGTSTAEYSILYRRTNSTTAQEIAKYPSSISIGQLLSAIVFGNPQGYVFTILDADKRAAFGIKEDGTIEMAKALVKNLTITDALTQLQLKGYDIFVGDDVLLTARYVKEGLLIDIQDASGNTVIGLKQDGTLAVAALELLGGSVGSADAGDNFNAEINHIDSNGQSLSNGSVSTPPISTVPRFDSIMFNGGVRNTDGGDTEQEQLASHASFIPLVETTSTDGTLGETPISGAVEQIKELILSEDGIAHGQQTYQLLGSGSGFGGKTLEQLNDSHYFRIYNNIQYAYQNAKTLGKTYRFQAMLWSQGEADDAAGNNVVSYKTALKAYIARVQLDLLTLTGQKENFKFITYQPVSHELATFGLPGYPIVALALAQLADEYSDAYLSHPNYMFPRVGDKAHYTAIGSKWAGAYFGLTYKRVVIDGGTWEPLKPIKAYVEDKIAMTEFRVPRPPLVFDTTIVADHPTKGFRLVDYAGNELAIASVSIVNQKYVKVVAENTIPLGSYLQYAYKSEFTNSNRNGPIDGPRGNLRDSQGDDIVFDPSGINKRMDNWCILFNFKIN